MSEIEELPENSDELTDEAETDDEFDESDEITSDKQAQAQIKPSPNSIYDFDKTTIIIGLQILPTTADKARQVLISAGIKGEPPLLSCTTLPDIEQVEAITDILEKLKQTLPQLAEQAKLREEKQRLESQNNSRKQVVSMPELPQQSSAAKSPSNQLTLF